MISKNIHDAIKLVSDAEDILWQLKLKNHSDSCGTLVEELKEMANSELISICSDERPCTNCFSNSGECTGN